MILRTTLYRQPGVLASLTSARSSRRPHTWYVKHTPYGCRLHISCNCHGSRDGHLPIWSLEMELWGSRTRSGTLNFKELLPSGGLAESWRFKERPPAARRSRSSRSRPAQSSSQPLRCSWSLLLATSPPSHLPTLSALFFRFFRLLNMSWI